MADYQSEAQLESELLSTLVDKFGYEAVEIRDNSGLFSNFRCQIDKLNGLSLSDKEFDRLLGQMLGKSRFECAQNLRQEQVIEFDSDGKKHAVKIFEINDWCRNLFQVSHQITTIGKHENRYDVTILVNGLPLVQIELKRRGMDLKSAFDQISRYQRESYKELFYYIQYFVISNGVSTRYYANNAEINKDYVFTWEDTDNKPVNNLMAFANERLTKCILAKSISQFMVLDAANKLLIAMRPYQVRAVENLVSLAKTTKNNGYIWHTTGSGKTITSFKLAQILRYDPNIDKVVFLIDRVDLNTQTLGEFNKFERDCFSDTVSCIDLARKFIVSNNRLIMTTIQKMSAACVKYPQFFGKYSKTTVFIIDECHRSNFGEMHKNIKRVFTGGQFFGFTGTPIFEINKTNLDFTTAAVFGGEHGCRDKYLIGEAIRDKAVLGFNVFYYETLKGMQEKQAYLDESNVHSLVFSDQRIQSVSEKILETYDKVTFGGRYNAMFSTSCISLLMKYYDELKRVDKNRHKITAVFTFQENDDVGMDEESQRDYLERVIVDYNKMFGTSFSTNTGSSSSFYVDVQKRMKRREIDLLLVVDMFLTGFDSKRLSALYLDKSLSYHRLIQAFSRTNRLDGYYKPHGNIICFDTSARIVGKEKPQRVLGTFKDDTDKAVALYADKNTADVVLIKPLSDYIGQFRDIESALLYIAPAPSDVDGLKNESDKRAFLDAFLRMIKLVRAMDTFVDFNFDQAHLGMTRQTYEDYCSKYKDLLDDRKQVIAPNDVQEENADFCLGLVQNDLIDFEYIMNLIKGATQIDPGSNRLIEIERIIKLLQSCSGESLKFRRDLLTAFMREVVPHLGKDSDVDDEFERFVERERVKDIMTKADELSVDYDHLRNLVDEYLIYEYISDSEIDQIVTSESKQKKRKTVGESVPNFKITRALIDEIKDYIDFVCRKYR